MGGGNAKETRRQDLKALHAGDMGGEDLKGGWRAPEGSEGLETLLVHTTSEETCGWRGSPSTRATLLRGHSAPWDL